MHHDQINAYKKAQPFQPFRLVLDDGQTFEVRDPIHILVTPIIILVGVGKGRSGSPKEFHPLPPEMIVRVERVPAIDKAS